MSKPTWPKFALPATARLQLSSGDVLDIRGGVDVETTYERIYSDRSVIADMKWQCEHGDHVHRFTGKHRKAVVTEARRGSKHVECDGSCGGVCGGEGYDVSTWLCAHDGSELDPRYVDDVVARTFGIVVSATDRYSLTVLGMPGRLIEGASLIESDGRAIPLPPLALAEMLFSSEDPEPVSRYKGFQMRSVDD